MKKETEEIKISELNKFKTNKGKLFYCLNKLGFYVSDFNSQGQMIYSDREYEFIIQEVNKK